MTFAVLFAPQARADLFRLFQYLIDRAKTAEDLDLAERAIAAIESAAQLHLSRTPFIYRKTAHGTGLRRELIVPFGASGYVLLYEIADPATVLILAVRHQLEQDYH
ncbi:type II toxin-antitoxin system RelE/ParE family toxin [Pseudacidovorax sp. RU35E]|uniref:type II toxin-antitoxin system RelE/ParE family toxin n=1 Tax=Pseudacidovorax sp. RU35E TaxID=1907403 RepID=UPI00095612DF|nr:type II toxin-antitoxin system RelE/ParE family toxin [Pseudacidovorax sp. RU35E]SIQ47847.1 Plasmid stabilization system protein ParE [Pseudacidovorax sp. RU35E]